MNQRALNKIHDKIDSIFDYIQDEIHSRATLDIVIDGREELHTLVDNLRKSADIAAIVERVTPLDFNKDLYDEEGTD